MKSSKKSMKSSQHFPLVVSSLVVSGAMFFNAPAQGAVFSIQVLNASNSPQVGTQFVLGNSPGLPLNLLSITSPEFPISQISNNNTTQIDASLTGGAVQPGSSYSFDINTEDNPDGSAVLRILKRAALLATPTGIEEQSFPSLTVSSNTSAGAKTPFSAFKLSASYNLNGKDIVFSAIDQLPGDELKLSDLISPLPLTFSISSQPITGYVPVDQLNDFSSPVEYTLNPGGSITATNPRGSQSVPEPSLIGGSLLVIAFAALSKGSRKLLALKEVDA